MSTCMIVITPMASIQPERPWKDPQRRMREYPQILVLKTFRRLEAVTAATGASTKYWVKTEASVSQVIPFSRCHSGVLSVDNREHLRLFDLTWGGYRTKCEKALRRLLYGNTTLALSLADGSIFCMIVVTPMSAILHDLACSPKGEPASLVFKLQKKLTKKKQNTIVQYKNQYNINCVCGDSYVRKANCVCL